METITISKDVFERMKKELEKLKQNQKADKELLADITAGIKDILAGNVEEV
ncbi:MAG: hypothetical protein AABX77_01495 [Nanoarchaeota archaeon]